MLETYIREQRNNKDILLMTHIVIGYPSLEASFEIVREMVEAGVDLMELQIPFSEPIADGPVILKANQDDSTWRQEWANLLIHDNWRFQERMWHYGVTFPMTPVTENDDNYPDLIELHDETTLEEWLTTLAP